MGHRKIGKRLGKGFASTSKIGTEKPTHLDTEHNGIFHQGEVCERACIPAMNLDRTFLTQRTRNGLLQGTDRQDEGLTFTGDLLKQQVRARRKQKGGYGQHRSTFAKGKKTMEKFFLVYHLRAVHVK